MTWVDKANHYWRIERVAGRWQLSRYSPQSEQWTRVGSYPSRSQAIQAAQDDRA
jgi:hypothetical protein